MTEQAKPSVLTARVRQEIDQWVLKFPPDRKRSAVLYALRVAQEDAGWVSTEIMDAVADYLELPAIMVYEVASFYAMYDLEPMGRHKISVCNSVSCMLRGSEDIIAYLQKKLKVGFNETTANGQFTLKEAECLAACVGAPMLMIDDKHYHENLTPESIDALLAELEAS